MRSSGGLQVIVAISLVVLALGPFFLGPAVQGLSEDGAPASDGVSGQPNFLERSAGEEFDDPGDTHVEPVDREVRFIADLNEEVDLPTSVERKYSEVYTREGARQLRGTVRLSQIRSLSQARGIGAVEIEGAPKVRNQPTAPGVVSIGADRLHEQGVTGEGVTVGVIDSGFQLSHPGVAGHVSAYRSFEGANGGAHGTAVASVVTDTAPDARLHLAAVGPSTTPSEYRQAVEWLERSGVDVIVDAGSYFGKSSDPNSSIAAVASNVSDDVVFVTSAGNYAQRHWTGNVSTEAGRIEFADGDRQNALNGGEPMGGPVTVSLRWQGTGDYDLFLVRKMPTGDIVVGRATGADPGPTGQARLSRNLPKGEYYVTVRANGTNASSSRLELFASHRLEHRTMEGSLTAPATAENVVTVGAYADGAVEPFSSRGPTADGNRGVDYVAPDTVRAEGVETPGGTSFSAPYVAGTVALIAGERPVLSSTQLRDALTVGATDVAAEGADPASGHGLINASASYEAAKKFALPHEAKFNESVTTATNESDPSPSVRPEMSAPGIPLRGWAAVIPTEDDATGDAAEADSGA